MFIGCDYMGTPEISDNVLIRADPYDNTDHCQDGYVIVLLERFSMNGSMPVRFSRDHCRPYMAPVKPAKKKSSKRKNEGMPDTDDFELRSFGCGKCLTMAGKQKIIVLDRMTAWSLLP